MKQIFNNESMQSSSTLIIIAILIGIYQINQIEDKLNQYQIPNQLSSLLPIGKESQSLIEQIKINIIAKNNELNFIENKNIKINNINTESIKNSANSNKSNVNNLPLNSIIPIANSKCIDKCKVLAIGDSVMGDIYFSVNRTIKKTHPDWTVVSAHKVSSGLSNSKYYDWLSVAQNLIQENQPDYIISLFGTNDAQGISYQGKAYVFGSQNWIEIYSDRTKKMNQLLVDYKKPFFWIELPQVASNDFNKKLSIIRQIHKSNINEPNLINNDELLGLPTDSKFAQFRQPDGIHLNAKGSEKISEVIIEKIFK